MPKQDNENNNSNVNHKYSETEYKNEERKLPLRPEKGMISHFILNNVIDFKNTPCFGNVDIIQFILLSQVYAVLRRASQAKHCHRLQSTFQHF